MAELRERNQPVPQVVKPKSWAILRDHSSSDSRRSHVVLHNSHKARNAQAQFIERFLPNGGTVADVEEPNDAERVPVRVQ